MSIQLLYLSLEFPTWSVAAHWSYTNNLALLAGFAAHDVSVTLVPVTFGRRETKTGVISFVKELLGTKKFDQVWFETEHSDYDDDILEWVRCIAPIRVALVFESMIFTAGEIENNSVAVQRRMRTRHRGLSVATHLLCGDYDDVKRIEGEGSLPVRWFPMGVVPKADIRPVGELPDAPAIFIGALYAGRAQWLSHPSLVGLLVRPESSPENASEFPEVFDQLMQSEAGISENNGWNENLFLEFTRLLAVIRARIFSTYLDGLSQTSAIVNLPQIGRLIPGRIPEGIAIGRPVVSWRMSDVPEILNLLEPGSEILLYDKSSPEELAEHLKHLRRDPVFAREIAIRAQKKLMDKYTSESFIGGILRWIDNGS